MAKTYTAAGTVAAGDVATAAAWNVVTADVNNLIVPPGVRAIRSTNLSYTSNTAITFEAVSGSGAFDTDSMWASGSPTLLTINTTGIYTIDFTYAAAFTGTVTRVESYLTTSVGSFIVQDITQGSYTADISGGFSITLALTAGNTISATIGFTGGSAFSLYGTGRTALSAVWIGRTS